MAQIWQIFGNLEFDCQLRVNLFHYVLGLETLVSFWHTEEHYDKLIKITEAKGQKDKRTKEAEGQSNTLETNMMYNKGKNTRALLCCDVTSEINRVLMAKM